MDKPRAHTIARVHITEKTHLKSGMKKFKNSKKTKKCKGQGAEPLTVVSLPSAKNSSLKLTKQANARGERAPTLTNPFESGNHKAKARPLLTTKTQKTVMPNHKTRLKGGLKPQKRVLSVISALIGQIYRIRGLKRLKRVLSHFWYTGYLNTSF